MKPAIKPLHVKFPSAPPVGTVFSIKERDFEIVDVKPHTRRDGGESSIITWVGDCIDCGVEFDQTTGRSFSAFRRRCEDCRKDFARERDRRLGPE